MVPAKLSRETQDKLDAEKELDGQNNEGDLVDDTTPEAPTDDIPPMS